MHPMMTSDAVWRRFLGNLKDYAIVLLDEEGNVAAWSEGARILKGYSTQEIVGTHFSIFATPESKAVGHPERTLMVAASVGRYEEEGWRVRKDKSRFWAHVIINAIYDDKGVLCGFGKVLRDFTDKKQALEQSAEQSVNIMKLLEYTARTDYLTGIDNRRSFDKMLLSATSAARRHLRPICLAMLDLDRFKGYNDEFGHQAGDIYLTQASLKWRSAMRVEDFIGRYGGEEFVVILPDTALEDAIICLERVRGATPPPLTCSVGLSQWDGQETPNALLGRTDQALYQAKAGGRNQVVISPTPVIANEAARPVARKTPRGAKATA